VWNLGKGAYVIIIQVSSLVDREIVACQFVFCSSLLWVIEWLARLCALFCCLLS